MYPEVQQLQDFYTIHRIKIIKLNNKSIDSILNPVEFTFREHKIVIQIVDEYEDLKCGNPLLNLLLVLIELSIIDESTDFLDWCSENEINASSEELRMYYNTILPFVTMIKTHFTDGMINYYVSDLDYQLNAAAARYLRSN